MTQTVAEILILVPSILHAGLVLFVAFVLQPILNDLDEASFGRFVTLLYRHATRSIYEIANSLLTMVAMIPYFIFYGFNHWWFIAGLVAFIVASTVGKLFKLPVYKKIAELDALGGKDTIALAQERRKLQMGNYMHALSCSVFVVLMVIQPIIH